MATSRLCLIPDCNKPAKSRGWCNAHYERYRLHGDPLGLGYSPKRKSGRSEMVLTCETCGSDFRPWKGRETTSRVCSLQCNGPLTKEAISNRPEDFFSCIDKTEGGCWVWRGPLRWSGYGTFNLAGAKHLAHRYSYELHKGPIGEGLFVCHSCDNPPCVNPDHLWLGTMADNMADMAAKGRAHKGPSVHSADHPLAKLTAEKVRAIRLDSRTGKQIAADYGVCTTTIYSVKSGKHWKRA